MYRMWQMISKGEYKIYWQHTFTDTMVFNFLSASWQGVQKQNITRWKGSFLGDTMVLEGSQIGNITQRWSMATNNQMLIQSRACDSSKLYSECVGVEIQISSAFCTDRNYQWSYTATQYPVWLILAAHTWKTNPKNSRKQLRIESSPLKDALVV